jgi:hypothetical protein
MPAEALGQMNRPVFPNREDDNIVTFPASFVMSFNRYARSNFIQ